MKLDAIVLGAGIVGVCTALQLQMRGARVALVDRRAPGMETSFGNAGLIQREAVYPYAMPRSLRELLPRAFNRTHDVRYHPSALPGLLPVLVRYWWHSQAARHARIASIYATLIEHCVDEHETLARAAGVAASLERRGWLKVFRTPAKLAAQLADDQATARRFGLRLSALDADGVRALEPALKPVICGGIHYTDAVTLRDPQALTQAYVDRFQQLGGLFLRGDARSLGAGWSVQTDEGGRVGAEHAVIALGPWSATLIEPLGYHLPLFGKRGYHAHHRTRADGALTRPVLDAEVGFVLAPMTQGIRLTTGAELARLGAPPTPQQLADVEPYAAELLPLGERVERQPWMGTRPCTPDMLPVLGAAPRHERLWFAFGHGHHGLTLGAITGRVLAELIVGEAPRVDPTPFSAQRFL